MYPPSKKLIGDHKNATILIRVMTSSSSKLNSHRRLASSTVTAVRTNVGQHNQHELGSSRGSELTTNRLSNGLFLATVENHSPLTRISLVFRAGTRYETQDTHGIVHRLRNLIGLSTSRRTAIDFNHYVAKSGAILTSSVTRDHLSFDVQIFRRNLVEGFRILDELLGEPFHVLSHELESSTPQMVRDANELKEINWPAYTLEKLHKVAFRRNGLANSLFSPGYAIGKHSPGSLACFAHGHLTTGNAVLVASGVSHDDVAKWASGVFNLRQGAATSAPEKATFHGGDSRKQQPSDLAVVQLGGSSTGVDDVRGTMACTVLANVLGNGPYVKWSQCGGQGRLAKAAKKATSQPFHISASNIGYEGAGLFAINCSAHWTDSSAVIKAAVEELQSVAENVSDQEVQAAKNRVKYRLLTLAENDDYVVEDVATQAAVRQSETCLPRDQAKSIDQVTSGDVQKAARNIVSGKLALSAIGRLDKTPYSDELLA